MKEEESLGSWSDIFSFGVTINNICEGLIPIGWQAVQALGLKSYPISKQLPNLVKVLLVECLKENTQQRITAQKATTTLQGMQKLKHSLVAPKTNSPTIKILQRKTRYNNDQILTFALNNIQKHMKPIQTQQILHKLHRYSFIHHSENSLVCIPLQKKYVLYLDRQSFKYQSSIIIIMGDLKD